MKESVSEMLGLEKKMVKKALVLGSAIALSLSFVGSASALPDVASCRDGVRVLNGRVVLDANGQPIRCGIIPADAGPAGIDPWILAAGAAVVVGGGAALIVTSSHNSNSTPPLFPASP